MNYNMIDLCAENQGIEDKTAALMESLEKPSQAFKNEEHLPYKHESDHHQPLFLT